MWEQVKSALEFLSWGLAYQDPGELSPSDVMIRQIEQRSRNYRLTGGQGRIVLIAGAAALGPAFDFAAELAESTENLIEVLYVDSRAGGRRELIDRLDNLGCDFQMTYLRGNLLERVADYNAQRQDIMAVVCNASEGFAEQLRSASNYLDPNMGLGLPSVMLIGGHLLA